MEKTMTKEPQYQRCIDCRKLHGLQTFGLMSNYTWLTDPKRLVFVLSRYKFVAKMFSGLQSVLEVGCGDALGTRIVSHEVGSLTAVDFDPVFVEDVRRRESDPYSFECVVHDILQGPVPGSYDAAYALDVIEHIPQDKENRFMANMVKSIGSSGTMIIGTPSSQSQIHASPASQEGHINCKDHRQLKELTAGFFHNVFLFSMNDEVVHTGFYPMAHYLLALCCHPRII